MQTSNNTITSAKDTYFSDQDMDFNVTARARYSLGEWAAKKMNFDVGDINRYAYMIDFANMAPRHHENPIDKIYHDLTKNNVMITRHAVAVKFFEECEKARKYFEDIKYQNLS